MWTAILNGLGWVLLQIYHLIPNFAAAVVIFSLVTKLILLPFSMKGKKGMMKMQNVTPKQKALEIKYKDDKERYNVELQKLWKEEKVNPMSGCLWTLIPFPILIALYQVVRLPLSHMMHIGMDDINAIVALQPIADFIAVQGLNAAELAGNQLPLMNAIHANFSAVIAAMPSLQGSLVDISFNMFGMNLAYVPDYTLFNEYWILPIISGAIAWASTVVMQRMQGQQAEQQQGSMKVMTYMSPVMSLVFGFMLPSVMSLYWIANTLFGMIQDTALTLYYRKKLGILSPAEQKAQELAAKEEAAQLEEARRERMQRLAENGPVAPKKSNMSTKKYRQLKERQGQTPSAPEKNISDDEYDAFKYYDDDELGNDAAEETGEEE